MQIISIYIVYFVNFFLLIAALEFEIKKKYLSWLILLIPLITRMIYDHLGFIFCLLFQVSCYLYLLECRGSRQIG